MKLIVWKWHHSFVEDGEGGTSLFCSEASAWSAVHEYVRENWDPDNMDGLEFTGNREEDVNAYFEFFEDSEWYTLTSEVVDFSDMPNVEEDIVLSPDECVAVVGALEIVETEVLAAHVGEEGRCVSRHVLSAYRKLKD